MGLKEYKAKRKFEKTPEPKGETEKNKKGVLRFVVQKHHASHLHYDFRLEMEGVLKSWAIPKGPSMNPDDKRLAMMVEDHPIEYGKFEGIIPRGNYGAGTVMVWDEGTYHSPIEDPEKILLKQLQEGNLKFILDGKKLKGEFALVKLKIGKGNEWLLIKKKDQYATKKEIISEDKSVLSNRNLEEIKNQSGEGASVWHSNKSIGVSDFIKDLKKAKMPHDIKPMMATLVDEPFDSEDWIYEIKWDGYRAIAEIQFNEVSLKSRNNLPFNNAFPSIVNSLSSLGVKAVLDGEICVVDESGKASFQLIQNYKTTGKGNVIYYVFDILYYDKYDLTDLPLSERKNFLKKILPDSSNIKYSDHVEGNGIQFFELAKNNGLEGIIAKKADSKYEQGVRGKNWLKIKVLHEQEAVVAGFTEPRGSRKKFGALVLGVYKNEELVYIGHTGGGFDEKLLDELYEKFHPLLIKKSPFKNIPKTNMPVTWVKPQVVCVVKFQEWTDEEIMRQPIFLGIRDDKDPKEVKREIEKPVETIVEDEKAKRDDEIEAKTKNTGSKNKPKKEKIDRLGSGGTGVKVKNRNPVSSRQEVEKEKSVSTKSKLIKESNLDKQGKEALLKLNNKVLKLTNLKKVFWPEEGYTKEDVIEYYHLISPYILPYLKNRPESLRRNPNGIIQESFFHKDMPDTIPDWIETVKIYSESNDKDINYMICQDKADLIYMANLGCIEINPWLSKVKTLDFPDYLVIDLDPVDVSFELVIEAALAVKEVLDQSGLNGFCKTSGSKGMHIYIPLGAKYDYDQSKQFAQLIASSTNKLIPGITSLERMPNKRRNKVYLDYLQNRKGQTLAAPYCLRPKPGATVSTPLDWSEVKNGLNPAQFNIKTIFKRLQEKGDLFKGVMGKGIKMEKALEKLVI